MIRSKADIGKFLGEFYKYASHDGNKYYLEVADYKNEGTLTIMLYSTGSFTIYKKCELFWDWKERELDCDDLGRELWLVRKGINELVRERESI